LQAARGYNCALCPMRWCFHASTTIPGWRYLSSTAATPRPRFRRKSTLSAVVNAPNVPMEIGVNKQWSGLALYEKGVGEARAAGHLYVGVIASHSNRDFLIKVPPRKPEADIPKNEVAGGRWEGGGPLCLHSGNDPA
jgi:hypothetical protein